MDSFEDYLKKTRVQKEAEEQRKAEAEKELERLLNLFEYEIYKNIPGTNNSYREDKANTSTKTLKHAHVYARKKGSGEELYSVSVNGHGHDGSSGITIPASHGDYFRSRGYKIPETNILEWVDLATISSDEYVLVELSYLP